MTDPHLGTRIVVADRSAEVCHALARLLGAAPDLQVVCTVQTEDELLAALPEAAPDVVLLDYQLPRRSATRLASSLRARVPDVAILVLLLHPGDVVDIEVDQRTAWILKDTDAEELRAHVRALAPVAT